MAAATHLATCPPIKLQSVSRSYRDPSARDLLASLGHVRARCIRHSCFFFKFNLHNLQSDPAPSLFFSPNLVLRSNLPFLGTTFSAPPFSVLFNNCTLFGAAESKCSAVCCMRRVARSIKYCVWNSERKSRVFPEIRDARLEQMFSYCYRFLTARQKTAREA